MSGAADVTGALFAVARHLDDKNWAALADAMTPDTRSYGRTGVDDVLARVRSCLDVCGTTQHLLGNVTVEIDGDGAVSRSAFRAAHVGAGPTAGRMYECMGDYEDHWRRVEGRWLLAARTVRIRVEFGARAVIGL